jgi:hypothetical protein
MIVFDRMRSSDPLLVRGGTWREAFSAPPRQPTVGRILVAGCVRFTPAGARVIPLAGARPVRLDWSADVKATLVRRELDDQLLTDIWGYALTRIDLTVGKRTRITVMAGLDTSTDKDER